MVWGDFWWGVFGSVLVEIVTLLQHYQTDPISLPLRYRKSGYWVVRILVALSAGGLVLAHGIEANPLLAINIGAATPAIVHTLAERIKPEQLSEGG